MYYYAEITCLPDEGVSTGFVLSKVMDTLHLSLVNLEKELKINPVGISFPEYRYEEKLVAKIGSKLRLFSKNQTDLERLHLQKIFKKLEDYIHIKNIRELNRPKLDFAIYKRVQPKPSKERLIRRKIKHTGQAEDVVRNYYQSFSEENLSLPFVHMRSHSSKNSFRLFVKQQTAAATEEWKFSTYGLSNTSAVPFF